jgi:hypothetical protein
MRDTSNYRKTKTNPRLIFSDFKFYSEAGLGDTSKMIVRHQKNPRIKNSQNITLRGLDAMRLDPFFIM